jgi:hypothetical protein
MKIFWYIFIDAVETGILIATAIALVILVVVTIYGYCGFPHEIAAGNTEDCHP